MKAVLRMLSDLGVFGLDRLAERGHVQARCCRRHRVAVESAPATELPQGKTGNNESQIRAAPILAVAWTCSWRPNGCCCGGSHWTTWIVSSSWIRTRR